MEQSRGLESPVRSSYLVCSLYARIQKTTRSDTRIAPMVAAVIPMTSFREDMYEMVSLMAGMQGW